MKRLAEVEEAIALMNEATSWSVMKWLRDKKTVRRTSDKANNALWAMQKKVKESWSDELRAAFDELAGGKSKGSSDPELAAIAKKVKEADDAAAKAHEDAEETFAKAEKILSTSMAREGCHKAILSWELYEKAIDKAEAAVRSAATK